MIGSKKKKAAKVGLFGDYIDGADAMLVYDVDSDAEEQSKLIRKSSVRSSKSKKEKKKEPSNLTKQVQMEKNIVVPDDKKREENSKEEDTEDLQDSMTKFRVKKPIKMPEITEGDEKVNVYVNK